MHTFLLYLLRYVATTKKVKNRGKYAAVYTAEWFVLQETLLSLNIGGL